MRKSVVRLYPSFKPEKYNLLIDIDKDTFNFSGQVDIIGHKVGRPSKRITLHQKDLEFNKVEVISLTTNKKIKVSRIVKHKSFDEIRIHVNEHLYSGQFRLKIHFKGKITKKMFGIYPCFYKHKNKEKTMITTQFESHFAREAFPCIDEPEAKAIFNLTIIGPKSDTILSNTEVISEKISGGRKTSLFAPTPIMSTYLLAFVMGEMHHASAKTKNGVLVRSWANISQPKSFLEYANSEAVNILEFFEDYFNTPFPLKKLDQVGLPDFESMAMENWGLITFREVGLLTDPINRSISSEQLITLVIAHEISHQWFGNLVTMKWWDDLWLNESFASIMENIAPDKLHPEWHQWEDFTTGRVLSCSHRDIYKDVQPVGLKVKHPDEIISLFDPAIVYAKGARLLSMLLEYIGENNFRKALQLYFTKFAYKNTEREDLWDCISTVVEEDISSLMTPWIEQSGQPLLKVHRKNNVIELSQQRFLMDGVDKKSIWPIPLLASPSIDFSIMNNRVETLKYANKEKPIFNINGSGHYIVDYLDIDAFVNLSDHIIKRQVSSISRITLINDMLLLARSGDYKLVDLLNIVSQCGNEPRDAVWSMLVRIVAQAQVLTDSIAITEEDIRAFKQNLAKHWYNKLGWKDNYADSPNTKHLRSTALSLSISGENPEAIKEALKFYETNQSIEKLPAEHRTIIASAVVNFGDKKYIKYMMNEYENSNSSDVQQSIMVALCSSRDDAVAKHIISWGLKKNKEVIRAQDLSYWFGYLMRNHHSRDVVWEWFTSNWEYLSKMFSGGKNMEFFIWYSSSVISTKEWQTKFKNFFSKFENSPASKRNVLIAYSEIEARIAWRDREEAKLVKYFSNLSYL